MTGASDKEASALEIARAAVSPVLDLLGIHRVINIDDQNVLNQNNEDYDPGVVVARLQSGSLPLTELVSDSVLREVFADADGEVLDLDEAVDRVRGGLSVEAQSRLAELSRLAAGQDDTPGHLDPVDVSDVGSRPALQAIFKDHGYQALTLGEWRAWASASLDDRAPTLVLVDRDFSREGEATDAGDRVVAELFARAGADRTWCCLLTHSAQNDTDEERIEEEILKANGPAGGSLVVLSKPQLDANPVRFAVRLWGVLCRQHLSAMRSVLSAALDAGHAAAADLLAKTSDFQLLSMFAAAIQEGVHEPDHVLRPLQAAARRAMSSAVRPDDVTRDTLAPLHAALSLNLGSTGLRTDDISKLQALELFDPADFLASTVQPVEPGDIFQIVDAEQVLAGKQPTSRYHIILLAQPCDVMVRGDGERGHNVPSHWVLARVKGFNPKDPSDQEEKDKLENVLLTTFLDCKPRLVKLAEIVHVPSIALDMCALDSNGYSRLTVGESGPSKASWSWTKRHEVLSARVEQIISDAKNAHIDRLKSTSAMLVAKGLTGCLDSPPGVPEKQMLSVCISVRNKRLAFGLRRAGRLNDAATRSLLVQATHHQGRPADEAALVINPTAGPPRGGPTGPG